MIHVIIGTKAQLIKMAPILAGLSSQSLEYNYISTGQHKGTMDEILANFGIRPPDRVLYDGKDITSVTQMIFWMLRIVVYTLRHRKEVFRNDKNGIVLVHGDTFSTLLGAVMGRLAGLKVAHVESGLRSFKLFHPFPEELTRLLTFRLSDYMFCPGEWAISNLDRYNGRKIDTGSNTLVDALALALPAIEQITDVEVPDTPYGIVTLHRFENIYSRAALGRVVDKVERISRNWKLLFILHKPTEKKLRQLGFYDRLASNPNIEFRKRYDYFRFIRLILDAQFVISDGGSNQEECYYLGKPILLLRKATERRDGVGRNCVVSRYDNDVIDEFMANLQNYRFAPLLPEQSPSKIIIEHCREFSSE